MTDIENSTARILSRIREECLGCGRDPAEVALLCVSKTHPAQAVAQAYAAGQRHFGESYASEACPKIEELRSQGFSDICWHFIGPLQSNKLKAIAAHFDLVESVDSLRHARQLSSQRDPSRGPLGVLVQVNISREPQKSGVAPEALDELVEGIAQLPSLQLRGLMGIAHDSSDTAVIEREFRELHDLFERLRQGREHCDLLSMGMTQDMGCAIRCGSTQVRIGTAIFGARQHPQPSAPA